ncbi:hypothetical protein IMZ31_23670 (plasmid) [Pontibacillus sp. ALD_SL1]|uniref:hypothetical protein n=1 Tax=Pontibacillus sp. ALD_SL1 TaxID=2777185 RepID=UPI001A95C5EE|nr:hypothetical protein [Pontibacillus sp. ALD_SL1]QST02451.1 hypothetical protein IMZ31_23670 [Pontibacillus sp. ALD_SL1]
MKRTIVLTLPLVIMALGTVSLFLPENAHLLTLSAGILLALVTVVYLTIKGKKRSYAGKSLFIFFKKEPGILSLNLAILCLGIYVLFEYAEADGKSDALLFMFWGFTLFFLAEQAKNRRKKA